VSEYVTVLVTIDLGTSHEIRVDLDIIYYMAATYLERRGTEYLVCAIVSYPMLHTLAWASLHGTRTKWLE